MLPRKSKEKPTVAEVVLELRKALGLTQKELAKAAGVKRVEINKVENGHNQATSPRMRGGLLKAFHLDSVDFSDLLAGKIGLKNVALLVQKTVRTSEVP